MPGLKVHEIIPQPFCNYLQISSCSLVLLIFVPKILLSQILESTVIFLYSILPCIACLHTAISEVFFHNKLRWISIKASFSMSQFNANS